MTDPDDVPTGFRELVQTGVARGIVSNDPSRYRIYERPLTSTTAR